MKRSGFYLTDLASEINDINRGNGWNVLHPHDWADRYRVPAVLALIHSEVSEALEAFRKEEKEHFEEELADVLIRLLDCAGGLKMDMDTAVRLKLEKNKTRGYRHGGKKV